MRTSLLVAVALTMLAGCSGATPPSEEADAPPVTTTDTAPTETKPTESDQAGDSPTDIADRYALEISGGERLGCTDTPPGPESESNPGCIYAAAFAGCLNGLEPGSIPTGREGDFHEPGLLEIEARAKRDCAKRRP